MKAKTDTGNQNTKKSEEEKQPPSLLVRFNHYGGGRSHAFHTVDSKYKIMAASEGDVAVKRATKKSYKPAYSSYKKKKKEKVDEVSGGSALAAKNTNGANS